MNKNFYKSRFKIECVVAWLDTYKRLLVRLEYPSKNFKSWLYTAA